MAYFKCGEGVGQQNGIDADPQKNQVKGKATMSGAMSYQMRRQLVFRDACFVFREQVLLESVCLFPIIGYKYGVSVF